jgi:hypothetical protein
VLKAAIELAKINVADVAIRVELQRTLIQSLRACGHEHLTQEAERFLVSLTVLQSECAARLKIEIEPKLAALPREADRP